MSQYKIKKEMSTEQKVVTQFRNDLASNGLEHVLDNIEEKEVYQIVSIGMIAGAYSPALTKKTIFSYVFFNQDTKISKSMIAFFKEMVELKGKIPSNSKRMITFFLREGILSSTNQARQEFLNTYGYKSKTRASKSHSAIDRMRFIRFYNYFIKKIVSAIRNPNLKRFPHLGLLKKANTTKKVDENG